MGKLVLLGLVLVGCAHRDASLRASTYEYGKVNRPYTGIPDYLRHDSKTCEACVPAQTPPADQQQLPAQE
jgi:hypothetical protein